MCEHVLTPAGAGAAHELRGLRVPQELLEALPFAQLWRARIILGLLIRHLGCWLAGWRLILHPFRLLRYSCAALLALPSACVRHDPRCPLELASRRWGWRWRQPRRRSSFEERRWRCARAGFAVCASIEPTRLERARTDCPIYDAKDLPAAAGILSSHGKDGNMVIWRHLASF